MNKIEMGSPHLTTITLNANRLYSLISRYKVAEWIKKRGRDMAYKRLTADSRAHGERKGMEKDTPCKWKPKESRDSYTYIRQYGH